MLGLLQGEVGSHLLLLQNLCVALSRDRLSLTGLRHTAIQTPECLRVDENTFHAHCFVCVACKKQLSIYCMRSLLGPVCLRR